MTKEQIEVNKAILAVGLFGALSALYATSTPPNSAVAAVVEGYMVATREKLGDWEDWEEAPVEQPAKSKQRRARRKKADMVALAAEATNA